MRAVMDLRKGSWSMDHTTSLSGRSMFYYVQSGGCFLCNPGYVTDRKDYNSMLMVHTFKGRGYLRYRGQTYSLEEGEGFIIDCMEHQYYATDPKELWEFKWLHFNGCESRSYFRRICENSSPVFKLSPDSVIPQRMDEIHNMVRDRNQKIDIISSCRIVEMLTELILGSSNYGEDQLDIPLCVQQAVKKMERNFNKNTDLDTLAADVGVSKYHLSRLFKKHTGYSPYEYLLNYRLSQSKNLLKSTELPICQIAYRVGFESPSHFINLFRKQEGITPLKFRGYWR